MKISRVINIIDIFLSVKIKIIQKIMLIGFMVNKNIPGWKMFIQNPGYDKFHKAYQNQTTHVLWLTMAFLLLQ